MKRRNLHVFPIPETAPALTHSWAEARVTLSLGKGQYRLEDGRLARQAVSCVITPEVADHVLVLHDNQSTYIICILNRENNRAQLSLPGMEVLSIAQAGLEIHSTNHMAMRSLGDIEITSASGSISLSAKNLLTAVTDSLVQTARHMVTHTQHCVMQAASLFRLHGSQTLITSDKDMKLDAERISLG